MLFLAPADLRELDASNGGRALEELLERRDAVVAFGDGDVHGIAAAALLFADFAVLRTGATLTIDTAEAHAAAAWRLGRGALRWQLRGAPAEEIVDAIADAEPHAWLEEWLRHRSVMALDSAAALIRGCGGDVLERAEFARLFAVGEPQKGLAAFLRKQQPRF